MTRVLDIGWFIIIVIGAVLVGKFGLNHDWKIFGISAIIYLGIVYILGKAKRSIQGASS